MSDERVDEVLADLDRALTVEPSPALHARLRTALGATPGRRANWQWHAVAAGSVLVLLGALWLWFRSPVPPSPEAVVSSIVDPPHRPVPRPDALPASPTTPTTLDLQAPVRSNDSADPSRGGRRLDTPTGNRGTKRRC